MTERLYYNDSYITKFQTTIREHITHDGNQALVLSQTYFYPNSGGQPNDTGKINETRIVDVLVRDEDGAILHILESPTPFADGQTVHGEIDWTRRFDHMQQHTGQHVLTQALIKTTQAKTVSFHLSAESVTIDVDVNGLTESQLEAAETLANDVIQANKLVTAVVREAVDQEGVRMRKLPKHIVTDGLRIVEIEDFDVTACGGTHVARTGEIGLIKLIKVEKRGDKTRLEFRCGKRALVDYGEKHQVVSTMATEMNCRFPEVPEHVAKLRSDMKAAQATLKELREQLVEYEAARLLADAPRPNGYALISACFEGRDVGEMRLLASRLTAENGVVVLLGTGGEKANIMFARSVDLPFDMGALLKQAANKLGGRGGGQAAFAQGGVAATLESLKKVIEETAGQLS